MLTLSLLTSSLCKDTLLHVLSYLTLRDIDSQLMRKAERSKSAEEHAALALLKRHVGHLSFFHMREYPVFLENGKEWIGAYYHLDSGKPRLFHDALDVRRILHSESSEERRSSLHKYWKTMERGLVTILKDRFLHSKFEAFAKDMTELRETLTRFRQWSVYLCDGADETVMCEIIATVGDIRYASDRLKGHPAVILSAVRSDPNALECAAKRLRWDPVFAIKAALVNPKSITHIPKFMQQSVANWAVKKDPLILLRAFEGEPNHELFEYDCPWDWIIYCNRSNRDFIKQLIVHDGRMLRFADEKLRADAVLALTASRQDRRALEYIQEPLRSSVEFVLAEKWGSRCLSKLFTVRGSMRYFAGKYTDGILQNLRLRGESWA